MYVDPKVTLGHPSDKTLNPVKLDSALDIQVAGNHYKSKRIQPVEYTSANNLNFLEGCIVKRITRWRDKPAHKRFEDLEKIKHEVDLLIEMEKKYGVNPRGEGQEAGQKNLGDT